MKISVSTSNIKLDITSSTGESIAMVKYDNLSWSLDTEKLVEGVAGLMMVVDALSDEMRKRNRARYEKEEAERLAKEGDAVVDEFLAEMLAKKEVTK